MNDFFCFNEIASIRYEDLTLGLARDLVGQLGSIAPFLLKRAALEKTGRTYAQPNLQTTGNCWVLVVNDVCAESIVRPAMILPLQWVKDSSDPQRRLPQGLCDTADRVFETFAKTNGDQADGGWSLQSGIADLPEFFSDISFEESNWRSAWASLYGSLKLAVQNLQPDPRILATGAWDENGLQAVTGIAAKACVAQEWGARQFYYPGNIGAAELGTLEERFIGFAQDPLFKPFSRGRNPEIVLADFISQLAMEPESGGSDDVLDNYYLLQTGEKRRNFYLNRIKSRIVERIQDNEPELAAQAQGRTLVCWVSGGNELIDVAVEAFQPEKVFLLKTEGFDGKNEVFSRLQNRYPELKMTQENLIAVPENLGIQELKTRVRALLRQHLSGQPLLLDLTSGKVSMSLSFYDLEKDEEGVTDIRYLYWDTKSNFRNQPIPRTTKPVIW